MILLIATRTGEKLIYVLKPKDKKVVVFLGGRLSLLDGLLLRLHWWWPWQKSPFWDLLSTIQYL